MKYIKQKHWPQLSNIPFPLCLSIYCNNPSLSKYIFDSSIHCISCPFFTLHGVSVCKNQKCVDTDRHLTISTANVLQLKVPIFLFCHILSGSSPGSSDEKGKSYVGTVQCIQKVLKMLAQL